MRPPEKLNAKATQSTASVIGGSAAVLRSGQGRRKRPEVAATLAASQRLSVSVGIATEAAASGANVTIASIHCPSSGGDEEGFVAKMRVSPRRRVCVMVAAS